MQTSHPFSIIVWLLLTRRRLRTDVNNIMIDRNVNSGMLKLLNFVQLNLKHSEAASYNLLAFLLQSKIHIALIQEPWVNDRTVKGLDHVDYELFYHVDTNSTNNPRSCILAHKSLNVLMLSNFSDADTTVVKIESVGEVITVISSYFDRNLAIPTESVNQCASYTKGNLL